MILGLFQSSTTTTTTTIIVILVLCCSASNIFFVNAQPIPTPVVACPSQNIGCYKCLNSTYCENCYGAYFPINGYCSPNYGCYNSTVYATDPCTACWENMTLINDHCSYNCSNSYNSGSTENCLWCYGASPICTQCQEGYQLNSSTLYCYDPNEKSSSQEQPSKGSQVLYWLFVIPACILICFIGACCCGSPTSYARRTVAYKKIAEVWVPV